jgi:WW domain-containing oxidoreductase
MNAAFSVFGPLVLKNVGEGAATEVWAAVHPKGTELNGQYLADCNIAKPRADANDAELAKKLWASSEDIVTKLNAQKKPSSTTSAA